MQRGWWVKFFIVLLVTLISLYTVLPTLLGDSSAVVENDKAETPKAWYEKFLSKEKINLGLDLKGGLSLTLGVDTDKAFESESQIYVGDLKSFLPKQNISFKSITREVNSSRIDVKLSDTKQRGELLGYIRAKFNVLGLVDEDNDGLFVFDITEDKKKEIRRYTIEQMLEMQRNRIDEFGVAEASIQAIGTDRILIQLPGIKEISRAQSILERTALLEFKIVDTTMGSDSLASLVSKGINEGKIPEKYNQKDVYEYVKDKIPEGTQVLWGEEKDQTTGEKETVFYLLKADALLTGKTLEDARIQYDQFNKPVVGIQFNPGGAEIFKKITEENQGKLLAIVLDDKVFSAPRINEPIPNGRAQIEFGGMLDRTSTLREAQDLAVILRAGSLPAPVEVLESRVVGPTLGKDSIRKGSTSVVIGMLIVVLFMLIYYGIGGFFADIALVLNMLLILAMMIAIDATLTLPGIAGIALTLGMAVDANVIINERIREEIKAGRPLRNAVSIGFKRSFLTILDANVTTLIAGFILLQYGTGPVKGFAVTLIMGIVISFFTAFAIVKLMFEFYLAKSKTEKMYI